MVTQLTSPGEHTGLDRLLPHPDKFSLAVNIGRNAQDSWAGPQDTHKLQTTLRVNQNAQPKPSGIKKHKTVQTEDKQSPTGHWITGLLGGWIPD